MDLFYLPSYIKPKQKATEVGRCFVVLNIHTQTEVTEYTIQIGFQTLQTNLNDSVHTHEWQQVPVCGSCTLT